MVVSQRIMVVMIVIENIVVVMIVIENIVVVMIVIENITIVYFLDFGNFGSRDVVGFDDTQVVVDKLVRVSFAFQTQDTVARKNLSFVTMGNDYVSKVFCLFFLTSTVKALTARGGEGGRYGGEKVASGEEVSRRSGDHLLFTIPIPQSLLLYILASFSRGSVSFMGIKIADFVRPVNDYPKLWLTLCDELRKLCVKSIVILSPIPLRVSRVVPTNPIVSVVGLDLRTGLVACHMSANRHNRVTNSCHWRHRVPSLSIQDLLRKSKLIVMTKRSELLRWFPFFIAQSISNDICLSLGG
ncbi:hypothetical protein Tco_0433349 [Tanacetum coccineum]